MGCLCDLHFPYPSIHQVYFRPSVHSIHTCTRSLQW